jgi:AcrR family transcriptional regulator
MAAAPETPPRRRGRPRSRPAPGGADDPREGIVAAAGALFATHGIDGVTMAQIAEASGLQQSSIYYWFKSKADVLGSILDRVNRVPLEIVEEARRSEGPVPARLHRLVVRDVLALSGFPFDINEIHRLAARDPETFARYWEERTRLDEEVESLVAEGVASGDLRPVDTRLAARTLLAADEATQHWLRTDARGDDTPEQVAHHVADVGVRGLMTAPETLDALLSSATPEP